MSPHWSRYAAVIPAIHGEAMKPGKPKPAPHKVREATPEQAEAVMRNDWCDSFWARDKDGRVYVDTRLPRRSKQ